MLISENGAKPGAEPSETPVKPAVKQARAFFELSLGGLKAANALNASPLCAATYYVLSSGVDNSKGAANRICTHAHRSIQKRLANQGFEKAEIAAAIQHLVEREILIDVAPEAAKRKAGGRIPRYQVSPDRLDDLVAVSHRFIGIRVVQEGRSKRHVQDAGPANLHGLLGACSSLGTDIDREQAQTDAQQTYAHLLKCQNFKKFAGVDPRAVAGAYRDCERGENPVYDSSYMPIAGGRTALVRFAVAPDELATTEQFAEAVLGPTSTGTCKAGYLVRLRHAINQLIDAQLLYRVAVLWSDDPRANPQAKALATVAVRGSWLPKDRADAAEKGTAIYEFAAQTNIDKLLHKWGTLPKSNQYTSDGESVFTGTQIYRYVVPVAQKSHWVLLDQYRVRWWGETEGNLTALGYDIRRTEDHLQMISGLVYRDVEDY